MPKSVWMSWLRTNNPGRCGVILKQLSILHRGHELTFKFEPIGRRCHRDDGQVTSFAKTHPRAAVRPGMTSLMVEMRHGDHSELQCQRTTSSALGEVYLKDMHVSRVEKRARSSRHLQKESVARNSPVSHHHSHNFQGNCSGQSFVLLSQAARSRYTADYKAFSLLACVRRTTRKGRTRTMKTRSTLTQVTNSGHHVRHEEGSWSTLTVTKQVCRGCPLGK